MSKIHNLQIQLMKEFSSIEHGVINVEAVVSPEVSSVKVFKGLNTFAPEHCFGWQIRPILHVNNIGQPVLLRSFGEYKEASQASSHLTKSPLS